MGFIMWMVVGSMDALVLAIKSFVDCWILNTVSNEL